MLRCALIFLADVVLVTYTGRVCMCVCFTAKSALKCEIGCLMMCLCVANKEYIIVQAITVIIIMIILAQLSSILKKYYFYY